MAILIHAALMSLDGDIADHDGKFDWSAPDRQVHAAVNDLHRGIGTHLYGRRVYDVMVAWENLPLADEPAEIVDWATIWRAADKVVYSRTLAAPGSSRTRVERSFDPDAVAVLLASSAHDVAIGGAELTGQALRAGLVDDLHFFVSPVVIGGGTRALPDDLRLDLELAGQRRFDNDVLHLHYRIRSPRRRGVPAGSLAP